MEFSGMDDLEKMIYPPVKARLDEVFVEDEPVGISRRKFLEVLVNLGGMALLAKAGGLFEGLPESGQKPIPSGLAAELTGIADAGPNIVLPHEYSEMETPELANMVIEYHQKEKLHIASEQELTNLELASQGKPVPTDYHVYYGGEPQYTYLNPLTLGPVLVASDIGLKPTLLRLTTGGHIKKSRHYIGKAVDVDLNTEVFRCFYELWQQGDMYITNELIIEPVPAGTQTLYHGEPHDYSASIRENHKSHIHRSTEDRDG